MIKTSENNIARIAGIVTGESVFDHTLYGEDFYNIKVMVQRLSGTVDVVPVTLPERLLCGAENMPKDGDGIELIGQLRSYNKRGIIGTKLIVSMFAREAKICDALIAPKNEVELVGYLCKEAALRTTPFMREITDMLLAVNRSYNKSDYLPCIAWGRNAHFVSGVDVGAKLHIQGRIQSRDYQKTLADGTSVVKTAYEVSCSSVELV